MQQLYCKERKQHKNLKFPGFEICWRSDKSNLIMKRVSEGY